MLDFLKGLFKVKVVNAPATPPTSGAIIAAKVTAVEKHPNADRLRVITLTDGVRSIGPVVCGAFNFDAGAIVALALPGATIAQNIHSDTHESFVLGTAKIRGIESQGMICAAFELGQTKEVGDKPEILILPEDTEIGKILY
jgi:phenylalanyl-tRNA synthetase beta chain